MAKILARCPIHGPVEVVDAFSGAGTVALVASAARCPVCGSFAPILDGNYSFDDVRRPGVTVFKPITPAQAVRVKTAVTWAKEQLDTGVDDEIVKEKVDAVLAQHAPGWKRAIDVLLSERAVNLYQLLGFILMLLVFFGLDPASQSSGPAPVPELTSDQVEEMLEEYLRDHGTESEAPPAPESPPASPEESTHEP
ncbi:hypothetical protein [Microbacterium maritypicum]|uniref:hypothetical protein n=1 Tax=Microbacterium maritypicum TaxID=33918 RepID=UPI003818841A